MADPAPPTSSTPPAAPTSDLVYGIDDVPPLRETLALGLQHYLTMFGSTVAIPLFMAGAFGLTRNSTELAALIATMFFVSGITTLLQTTLGNRLPIVQGGTFSILSPAIIVCTTGVLKSQGFEVQITTLQGAIILGGAIEILFGYSGLIGFLLRFIGPITIAPTIALIGLALFKFGAPNAGRDWILGGTTILFIIAFSQIFGRIKWGLKRAFELYPILLAILGAWGLAGILTAAGYYEGTAGCTPGAPGCDWGYVDFTTVGKSAWFSVPEPFQWGMPRFDLAVFIAIFAGFLSSMIESIGDYYACARLSGAPIPTRKTVNRGIGMEGIGSVIAGIFGTGNATTSYSENIGAIGLTRVGSRRVVQAGAVLMLVLGAFPKFGALFTAIPSPIVGGMYCALFGMIASVGLSNLQFVDLNSARNLFIIGFSFFMGLSVPEYFTANPLVLGEGWEWLANVVNTIGQTGMAVGALLACVLDNVIPGTPEERGLAHMRAPGG